MKKLPIVKQETGNIMLFEQIVIFLVLFTNSYRHHSLILEVIFLVLFTNSYRHYSFILEKLTNFYLLRLPGA